MRILLLTSTARGHALAEALSRSRHRPDILSICPKPNLGIRALASSQVILDLMNFDSVLSEAKKYKPDFAIIGPDDPIGSGLADALEDAGIPTIAPKKSLARIESSKGFTRQLLEKYGINASPQFRYFTVDNNSHSALIEKENEMFKFIVQDLQGNYVIKYDALKGGKGVKVSGEHLQTPIEGVAYALECLRECGRVVIEEKLIGVEFSLLSFVSGTHVVDMPAVQDHKRAFAGDTGPNTGGMGTYSDANHSLPFLAKSDLDRAKEINRLTAEALLRECGESYRGILYGGYIAVRDGIRLIEFNARFGDPEALNLLPILSSDFVDICLSMIDGTLSEELVTFERTATVCKYIVPKSYPDAKEEVGSPVRVPSEIPSTARVYYGDITESQDGSLLLGGSRSIGIVGIGQTIADAEKTAELLCAQVQGPVRYRSDIGTAELLQQRVDALAKLRAH